MANDILVEVSRVSAKGQVTIPKNIRELIGVESGELVAFVTDSNDEVKLIRASEVADKINSVEY